MRVGRRKKKVRGDRQWDSRVYAGWRTDVGGYLAFFSPQVFEENLVSFASRWDPQDIFLSIY